MTDIESSVRDIVTRARVASRAVASLDTNRKNAALVATAELLDACRSSIREANERDLEGARQRDLSAAMLDRLTLTEARIDDMIRGLHEVVALPDPVGEIAQLRRRPSGIQVGRMRIPLGVIGIIYESRPNVTVETASLCLKSGNACVLKGGSEAFHSNMALAAVLREGSEAAGVPVDAIQLIASTDRAAVGVLLEAEEEVDVIIPRGGEQLIRFVAANSRIPVIKHYKGVCHVYLDASAELEMSRDIVLNAKVQRPSVCNALETLLVSSEAAERLLPVVAKTLVESGVELRGCERTCAIVPDAKPATEEDWGEEYLDLILAIRIVDGLDEAIAHIQRYGSEHTETIVTWDYSASQRFLREVNSSVVMVNASTRFSDGGQLGLGAEIGISTTKLHAFGPMGLEELTTRKFIVLGEGQVRE